MRLIFDNKKILITFFSILIALLVYLYNNFLFYSINYLSSFIPNTFWILVTEFGNAYILLGVLSFLFIKHPVLVTRIFVALLISTIIVRFSKEMFAAIRPPGVLPLDTFNLVGSAITENSFPSGHATTISAFICCFTLSDYIPRRFNFFPLLFLAITCVSRVAIGVHWPIDILIGFYIGFLSAYISIIYIPISHYLSKNILINILMICIFTFALLGLITGRGAYYLESSYMFIILGYLFIMIITCQLFRIYKSIRIGSLE
tara:strand:+ start:2449 stop:3228 length:780 start_codon:yes stop_codon:yes gene_type:complete